MVYVQRHTLGNSSTSTKELSQTQAKRRERNENAEGPIE